MKIASYVMFALFGIISIIHLVFCYLENHKARKITKMFCVSTLVIALILYAPAYPLIYIGALFGLIGDYFMINDDKMKSLILGISFFFIGHIFYAIELLTLIQIPKWGMYLYAVLEISLILVLSTSLYPKMKYMAHAATVPGIAYFIFLTTNLILTISYVCVSDKLVPSILMPIGYALFLISDTILLYTSYIKHWKRKHVYIMSTYLLAQALITVGLALAVIG